MTACTPFRSTPLSAELGHGSLDYLISGAIVPQLWSRTCLNAPAQKSFGGPGCDSSGISILQRSGQGTMRSDIVVADIPEGEAIVTCVAMGYPDDSFSANAVKSDREANNDFARYVGFAD